MSEITLYKGDCLIEMNKIADKSVDMILCDLPYGFDKTRAKWDNIVDIDLLFSQYNRIIKDNGAIILFGNEPFSSILRMKQMDLYKYDIKWIKNTQTGFANSNYRPMNQYEDILVFSKANASVGGKNNSMIYNPQGLILLNKTKKNHANRQGLIADDTNNLGNKNSLLQEGSEYIQKFTNYPSNVIYFDVEHKRLHPTQKPTKLLEYLIKTYSNENDAILDNCMGSGSTGVACVNTNRNFIGIEKDEKYFEIAKDRIEKSKESIFDM